MLPKSQDGEFAIARTSAEVVVRIGLLLVLATILALIGFGYTLAFYGVGVKPFIRAFLDRIAQ